MWNWSEVESRRLWLAGGGADATFAAQYARALEARTRIVRGLDDASYHGIIGGAFYLITGVSRERILIATGELTVATSECAMPPPRVPRKLDPCAHISFRSSFSSPAATRPPTPRLPSPLALARA